MGALSVGGAVQFPPDALERGVREASLGQKQEAESAQLDVW